MSWIHYRNWSLRKRLVLLFVIIAFGFMLITTLLLEGLSLPREQAKIKQQNQMVHQFLVNDLAEILLTGNPDVAARFVDKLTQLTELQGIWLYDLQGKALFHRAQDILHTEPAFDHSTFNAYVKGEFWVSTDVVLSDQQLGRVVYFYQGRPLTQRLMNSLLADLWLIPLLILVAIPLANRVARHFLQPFELLATHMSSASAETGELSLQIGDESEEVKLLYQGFNRLESRIAESMNALHTELSEKAYLASHDSLTGLLNRAGFNERVQAQLTELKQKPSSIYPVYAYLDLDQFKLINDTVGHNAGDVYLRQLAHWIEEWLPEGAFVGRLGGDEFGIWLLDSRWANTQIQSLIDLIRERRFMWESKPFQVGASVGLIEVNRLDMPLMWLYQAADTACYSAKSLGRDRLHWYKEDDQDVQGHQRDIIALNQVRAALGKGPERFEIWAQTLAPIHPDVDDGLLHYEVLIRLRDADNQIVNPGVFLPAAERYGELLRLDTWVLWNYLEQACASPEHLERLGFVDINVTGAALVHPDFRATIEKALDTFDFPWHKLTLEVTETTAVRNFEQARALIEFCKSQGIRFALDDFGSGMASFDYLKRLPFDVIKIDGSFIVSIVDNPMDETMVNFMVQLANLRGQLTVAEFVENEAVVEKLKANGVHYAQGYHFGRPKPFIEWLNS